MVRMKEIKLHYTEELLRQAARGTYFRSLRSYRDWIGTIRFLSVTSFLLLTLFFNKHGWLLVALTTVVTCEVLVHIRIYNQTVRMTLKEFQEGEYEGWTLSYTEEQFAVISKFWTVTIPWKSISEVTRRSTFWVLARPRRSSFLLPLDCLDAEDREFITRKTQTAISD